jgi:hypothetical protein
MSLTQDLLTIWLNDTELRRGSGFQPRFSLSEKGAPIAAESRSSKPVKTVWIFNGRTVKTLVLF